MKRLIVLTLTVFAFSQVSLLAQDAPKIELFGGYSFLRDTASEFAGTGWSASVAANPTKLFGIVADFGGHQGTFAGNGLHSFEYLFGPRVNFRTERVTVFGHALYGGFHRRIYSFAMGYGGGLDVKVNGRIDIRVVQFDWLVSQIDWVRFGFGVVFKGSK